MKKILVPVDFSAASKYALQYAEWLAQPIGAKIIVLHIYSESTEILSDDSKTLFQQNLSVRLKRFMALYPNEHEDKIISIREPECSIHQGNVVESIVEKSQIEEVDLIIIGTRAKHSWWEHLTGSVSSTLATKSTLPVLIIPEGTSFQPIKNIALATEKFLKEGKALQRLDVMANTLHAEVHPFYVNQFPADFSTAKEEVWPSEENALYPTLTMIRNRSVQRGIEEFLQTHPCEMLAMYLPNRTFLEEIIHVSHIKKQVLAPHIPLLVFQ